MERDDNHWQARLPEKLLAEVVWPVQVEAAHDDGVPASKWRGLDALGLLCYYRHHFLRWDELPDDEGVSPVRVSQEESFEAWRSLLGPWVRRLQRSERLPDGRVVHSDSGFEIVPAQQIPRL